MRGCAGAGQLAQWAADLLRGGDNHGVDLSAGLDAGLHRAPAGHPQHPDHLHLRIAGLRRPARASSGLGIQRVGLAIAAALRAVGAVHLDHSQAVVG